MSHCLLPGCSASATWHRTGSSPTFGSGEEQQGGVNPVLGHGRRGFRNKRKTVTQEVLEGDAKSAYAGFQTADLASYRLLSGPSGFVCVRKCDRSGAGPECCLGMVADTMWFLAPPWWGFGLYQLALLQCSGTAWGQGGLGTVPNKSCEPPTV